MRKAIAILATTLLLNFFGCSESATPETPGPAEAPAPQATIASGPQQKLLSELFPTIRQAIEAQDIKSVEDEILRLNEVSLTGPDEEWKALESLLGLTAARQKDQKAQLDWYHLDVLLCLKWVESSPQSALALYKASDALTVTVRNRPRNSYLELFADGTPVANLIGKVCSSDNVRDTFGTVSPHLTAVELIRKAESLADKEHPPIEGPFFFSLRAGYLTEYASMLYEEGVFNEASLKAWKNAQLAWTDYLKTPVVMDGVKFYPTPELNTGTVERREAESMEKFIGADARATRCEWNQDSVYVDLHRRLYEAEQTFRNGGQLSAEDQRIVVEGWKAMLQFDSDPLQIQRLRSRIDSISKGHALE